MVVRNYSYLVSMLTFAVCSVTSYTFRDSKMIWSCWLMLLELLVYWILELVTLTPPLSM